MVDLQQKRFCAIHLQYPTYKTILGGAVFTPSVIFIIRQISLYVQCLKMMGDVCRSCVPGARKPDRIFSRCCPGSSV